LGRVISGICIFHFLLFIFGIILIIILVIFNSLDFNADLNKIMFLLISLFILIIYLESFIMYIDLLTIVYISICLMGVVRCMFLCGGCGGAVLCVMLEGAAFALHTYIVLFFVCYVFIYFIFYLLVFLMYFFLFLFLVLSLDVFR